MVSSALFGGDFGGAALQVGKFNQKLSNLVEVAERYCRLGESNWFLATG
jgi:hypothetical protein